MPTRPIVTLALAGVALVAAQRGFAQEQPAPATAVPPAVSAPVAMPPGKLVGLDAWERLKGNTIEGKTAGDSFAEFFDAGGGVRYVDKDGLSTGTWSVQKTKVCFDFPDDDDRSCSAFEVTGEAGTSTDDDGSTIRFSIVQGNSKGL